MPHDVLLVILGFGAAVYVGALYLWSEDENREQFHIFGLLMAVIGTASLAVGIFEKNALLGAAAALSGAGAVFAGSRLASTKLVVYQGMVAALGVLFLAGLGYGFGSVLDLSNVGSDRSNTETAGAAPLATPMRRTHIRGIVSDNAGQPVAKAQVSLRGPLALATPYVIELTTDAKGAYEFDTAAPGMYELRVVVSGFETLSQSLSVEVAGLDMGALRLKAKPEQELTAQVLGVAENVAATPTALPTIAPAAAPSPSAALAVLPIPCTATPTTRLFRSPTRVISATATKAAIGGTVPTATPRPNVVGGGPVLSTPTVPKPPATATVPATRTRTATRTPTQSPGAITCS